MRTAKETVITERYLQDNSFSKLVDYWVKAVKAEDIPLIDIQLALDATTLFLSDKRFYGSLKRLNSVQ